MDKVIQSMVPRELSDRRSIHVLGTQSQPASQCESLPEFAARAGFTQESWEEAIELAVERICDNICDEDTGSNQTVQMAIPDKLGVGPTVNALGASPPSAHTPVSARTKPGTGSTLKAVRACSRSSAVTLLRRGPSFPADVAAVEAPCDEPPIPKPGPLAVFSFGPVSIPRQVNKLAIGLTLKLHSMLLKWKHLESKTKVIVLLLTIKALAAMRLLYSRHRASLHAPRTQNPQQYHEMWHHQYE